MKILKRILFIVVALIIVFSAVACGADNGNGDEITELSGNTINVSGKAPVASKKETPVSFARLVVRGIDENDMPIGGFFAPSDDYKGNGYKLDSLITEQTYKKIEDCGLNYLVDFQNGVWGENFEKIMYVYYKNVFIRLQSNRVHASIWACKGKTFSYDPFGSHLKTQEDFYENSKERVRTASFNRNARRSSCRLLEE